MQESIADGEQFYLTANQLWTQCKIFDKKPQINPLSINNVQNYR